MSTVNRASIFVITQGEDDSPGGQELAQTIGKLPPRLQNVLLDTFGFRLEVRDGFRLHTNPSRVGFGALHQKSETVNVVVLPKIALDVESLFNLIGAAQIPKKPTPEERVVLRDLERVRSEGVQVADWLRHTRDAATLRAIADVARRGRNQTHVLQHEVLRSRFKGRLEINAYLRNFLSKGQVERFPVTHLRAGQVSLQDEVLANTARRLGSVYDRSLLRANPILQRDFNCVRTAFADVPRRVLTLRDVIAASRPPYPFGYAHALITARNFWLGRGARQLQEVGVGVTSLWSAILDLDYIFETFVGAFLERFVLAKLFPRPLLEFQKRVIVSVGESIIHPRQDWVLRRKGKTSCVVDAKYKKAVTTDTDVDALQITPTLRIKTTDIYQMQSYLSHIESAADSVGILAYPTGSAFLKEIAGFRNRSFAMGVPVCGNNLEQAWEELAIEVSRTM